MKAAVTGHGLEKLQFIDFHILNWAHWFSKKKNKLRTFGGVITTNFITFSPGE